MNSPKKNCLNLIFIVLAAVGCCFAGKKIVVPHDFPSIESAFGQADEGDTIYVTKGSIMKILFWQTMWCSRDRIW
jgi:hypothetical protein